MQWLLSAVFSFSIQDFPPVVIPEWGREVFIIATNLLGLTFAAEQYKMGTEKVFKIRTKEMGGSAMKPIRILSVAPYGQLQELICQVAGDFPEIRLDTFTGNLDKATEYISGISLDAYDAIISRGGTATRLRKATGLTVVDVEISVYDMLRTLLAAVATKKPFAVVGYENTISTAEQLCRILNIRQPQIRQVDQQTVGGCLKKLTAAGVQLIIGDVIATEEATKLGLQSMLLTSSADSIRQALVTAIGYATAARHKTMENTLYRGIADLCSDGIIILDQRRQTILINPKARALELDALTDEFPAAIEALKENPEYTFFHKAAGHTYAVDCRAFPYDSEVYYLFSIRRAGEPLPNNGAIHFENSATPLGSAHFLFSDSTYIRPVLESIQRAITGKAPVMIWGNIGTEKATVARYIYRNGANRTKPLIHINCPALTLRQWQSLTENPRSVLNGSGYTVYFENIHQLSPELQFEVGNYIENTRLQLRHFLLSSCIENPNLLAMRGQLSQPLYQELYRHVIHMPDLDSRREDLEALAGIYIAQYNHTLGRQVIGLEPEALELLKHFHWYLNLDLFQKAIFQLVLHAQGYYITARETEQVLTEIRTDFVPTRTGLQLDLSKTLEEIERDIIWHIMQEENMNQSRVAKRLNISRTTVWRRLNE